MFEQVYDSIFRGFGVRMTVPAIIYIHYGAVHVITSIIGEDHPDTLDINYITEVMREYLEDLQNVAINIEEQEPDRHLNVLIPMVGHRRNVYFDQEAQRYLNTLIVGMARGVITDAAKTIREVRGGAGGEYISPDDLEDGCRRVFREKGYFIC